MNSLEIVEAFSQMAREKNIDRNVLTDIIEDIFKVMIKKKFGSSDNFDVIVNMDKGAIEIYHEKTIVDEVVEPALEIDLETARKTDPDLEIGDEFVEVVDPDTFGRRLIISAAQMLNQRIRDIEKEALYEEFSKRLGEILIGEIRQLNKREIYINLDKTEVVLPKEEQIHNERYRRGDSMRVIVKDVEKTNKGPRIIVSRAEPSFLVRLFELEVPEIYDGIIEIKSIAREAGERSKIAVSSNDKRIDAVGACVGMKGVRIQAIVKELNSEKIDIINWSPDPEVFIARALSPAKPINVSVFSSERRAVVVIDDDEISTAVGKKGQNIRLASNLTGYEIDTIRKSEYDEIRLAEARELEENVFGSREEGESEEELEAVGVEKELKKSGGVPALSEMDYLTYKALENLENAGFKTLEDIRSSAYDDILKVDGIGKITAQRLTEDARKYDEENEIVNE